MNFKLVEDKNRISAYNLFSKYMFPFISVTYELDITDLIIKAKEKGYKFSQCFNFILMQACNNVKEFRYRIKDDRLIEYDKVAIATTSLSADMNLSFLYIGYTEDFEIFLESFRRQINSKNKDEDIASIDDYLDAIYTSCFPWISYTGLITPIKSKNFSIPTITYGKFFKHDNVTRMPITIQVHHGLVDGYHLGLLNNQILKYLESFCKEI